MYQHSHRLHAEVLYVPFLHKIPQKLHRSSCFVPGCKGKLMTFIFLGLKMMKLSENWPNFVSSQVEEQPRKLEHVIKVSHVCLNRDQPHLDSKSEKYLEQVTVSLVYRKLVNSLFSPGPGVGQQWEYSAPDSWLWCSYRPPPHPRGEMLSAGQRSVIFTTFIVDFRSWVDCWHHLCVC